MKKNIKYNWILLLTLVCFFPNLINAQSGRVGVNTSNPKTLLDVEGKKDAAGVVLSTDVTGFQAPRLTLQELNGKMAGLYTANQNGSVIYITSIAGATAAGQTINITSPGFYYYDSASNAWQTNSKPLGLIIPEWQFYRFYDFTATSGQTVAASGYNSSAIQYSYEDLTAFNKDIIIPAGKSAKIVINYSIVIGVPSPQQTGFMGVRMLKNGTDYQPGTRYISIPIISNTSGNDWSLENVSNFVVDIIPSSPTAQTINYKLQSILGNSNNAARYLMLQNDITNPDDQDWGLSTWTFTIYLK